MPRFSVLITAALAICSWSPGVAAQGIPGLAPPLRGELPAAPAPSFHPEPAGVVVMPVATGLRTIWSLEFAPDGRLFITEREGRVRVMTREGALDPVPWLELPNVMRKEDGLLGLALDPDFVNQPWVYLFYTVRKGDALVNRVSRFREENGRAGEEQVLLDDLESSVTHNGGRLRFGEDGMLYVGLGEIEQPLLSQDLTRPHGSILRLGKDGKVPWDNPWPGNPIWAYGIRNPGGLALRPGDGALFEADHGPSSEWGPLRIGSRDEINIIRKGANYGWPHAVGAPNHPAFVDPILSWIPGQAPGDLVFYDGALFPEMRGDLLYATLRGETLMRIRFGDTRNPDRVTGVEWWFHSGQPNGSRFGRLRGMTVGPDGAIYVGTSNVERGRDEDVLLRITPASPAATPLAP